MCLIISKRWMLRLPPLTLSSAHMSQPDGKLYRRYKDGQARFNAYLEDYAAFVRALIALYEATFEPALAGRSKSPHQDYAGPVS